MANDTYEDIVKQLGGEVIKFDANTSTSINPLEVIAEEKEEVIAMTLQDTYEFIECFQGEELNDIEKEAIEKAFKIQADVNDGVQVMGVYHELLSQVEDGEKKLVKLVNVFKVLLGKDNE